MMINLFLVLMVTKIRNTPHKVDTDLQINSLNSFQFMKLFPSFIIYKFSMVVNGSVMQINTGDALIIYTYGHVYTILNASMEQEK